MSFHFELENHCNPPIETLFMFIHRSEFCTLDNKFEFQCTILVTFFYFQSISETFQHLTKNG